MPRAARRESQTGLYHVIARGFPDRPIFADDGDRARFLAILGRVGAERDWKLFAYCLLSTHYHLVLHSASAAQLSNGVRLLHTRYVGAFNARHRTRGSVLAGRFHSRPITRESHLHQACVYVALNPVRAGLVARAAEWRWSSYCASAALAPRPRFLATLAPTGVFGDHEQNVGERFRVAVEAGEQALLDSWDTA